MIEIELKDGRIITNNADFELAISNFNRARENDNLIEIKDGLAVKTDYIVRIEEKEVENDKS